LYKKVGDPWGRGKHHVGNDRKESVWSIVKNLIFILYAVTIGLGASAQEWQPPGGQLQIPIWPDRPPGVSEAWGKPETFAKDTVGLVAGKPYEYVSNVSVPTMTVYPPKNDNNGGAIVVFPGGGFQILAIDLEGTEICDWVNANHMTCILLKYRVPRSAHYWDDKCKCSITPKTPTALQDAQRTLRLIRFNAKKWDIDPHKIGVIGFSAGGYLVAQTSTLLIGKPIRQSMLLTK
jgi:acetyl esterase/lipase